MKIANILAREIFDSRAVPTIECELILSDGQSVTASVPSGISCGSYEAYELRDNEDRFRGKGVLKAIKNIEEIIAPHLIGKDPNFILVDDYMNNLDGTPEKKIIGANAMLAVSLATIKAHALIEHNEVYEFIAQCMGSEDVALPFPMFNMINGGAHATTNLQIQECMLVPVGAQNYRQAYEIAIEIFYAIHDQLTEQKYPIMTGVEGGFILDVDNNIQVLDFLTQVLEEHELDDVVHIALDMASTQFYDKKTERYLWEGDKLSSEDMIALYVDWSEKYPIYSIEDGLAEDDWDGWKKLMAELGDTMQIVGDDIFATNPTRILHGVQQGIVNSVIIKPNQVGTVTETLQAIKLCKEAGINTIISHRSGETEDTFIADLAVGVKAGQLKAGGPGRGERVAKYNRLLRIEDYLLRSLLINS
jgi:enolase